MTAEPDLGPNAGRVYFARALPHGPARAVKIGYSGADWGGRVQRVIPRHTMPAVLRVIPGTPALERAIHGWFAAHRLTRDECRAEGWTTTELFHPDPALLGWLAGLQSYDARWVWARTPDLPMERIPAIASSLWEQGGSMWGVVAPREGLGAP